MDSKQGVFFDFIEDANITTVMDYLLSKIDISKPVLIKTLDSINNIKSCSNLIQVIHQYDIPIKYVNQSLLVDGKSLIKITNHYDLFTGFDELWFLNSAGEIDLFNGVSIVTPPSFLDVLPTDLIIWMKKADCYLGLGDGCGLNYITTEKTVASLIENCLEG
jgi:hypothetical protein